MQNTILVKMKTKIKFTEDFIKGIVNGVMITKGAMSPSCYSLEVKTYNGMNHILLKANNTMEESISLGTLQEIQYAIKHTFDEECDAKIENNGVVFSILERDEY